MKTSEDTNRLRLKQSMTSSKVIAKVTGFNIVPLLITFVKLKSANFFDSVASNISIFKSPKMIVFA